MGPLTGVRVLDLSRYPPGRYCSMILGDLGAEVIMVEAPKNVSDVFSMLIDDTSALYVGQNRNKKCMAVNFKKDEGRDIFCRLVEKADVLIEGNLPGTLKRRGLDYETLRKLNPGLIYCSITSYGQDGPYANRSGHEINFDAVTSVLGWAAHDHGTPTYLQSPSIVGSLGGTSQASIAIISALFAREKTGEGQYIDVSVTDGAIFYHWLDGAEYLLNGNKPVRAGLPTGSDMAWMNIYRAKDGKFLTVGCTELWRWTNFCKLMGREDYIPHQFDSIEKQREMYEAFSGVFEGKDRDEWIKLLDEVDVTVSPVYEYEEMFEDPHFKHRRVVVEVEHPTLGRIKLLNTPFKLSGTPAKVRSRPPLWAEHTREILSGLLGYSDGEIDRLIGEEIVE